MSSLPPPQGRIYASRSCSVMLIGQTEDSSNRVIRKKVPMCARSSNRTTAQHGNPARTAVSIVGFLEFSSTALALEPRNLTSQILETTALKPKGLGLSLGSRVQGFSKVGRMGP